MTEDEVVEKLDGTQTSDPEQAHIDADRALLDFVRAHHPAVADAYERVGERAGAWWYG